MYNKNRAKMKLALKHIRVALFVVLATGFFGNGAMAKNESCIFSIFSKYENYQGVTMLSASKELFKQYKITQFKSIIFENGVKVLPEIRACIEKEKAGAVKMKETVQDGLLMGGYYRLKAETPEMNRYLIFKVKEKKVTLIYVEGSLTPDELVELLK